MPAARRLEDGHVELRLGQHARRAAEPGPVPRLDQLAANVDAVGVRHADPAAGRAQMWAMSRVVVLLPFVPVTATIGMRGRGRLRQRPERHRAQAARARVGRSSGRARRAPRPRPMDCEIVRRRHGKAIAVRRRSTEWRVAIRGSGSAQRRVAGRAHRRAAASPRPRPRAGLRAELELDRRAREEPIRAVQDAQLEELDVGSARLGLRRHGA